MKFTKQLPHISFEEFKRNAVLVKVFRSYPKARKYEVIRIERDLMQFKRLDANQLILWSFDLKQVYKAYIELVEFETINFKNYIPRRQSPARGLLLHLNLLKL